MDAETRAAIARLQDQMDEQDDVNQELRIAFAAHMTACAENAKTLGEVKIILENMRASQRLGNMLKSLITWIAAVTLACVELWRIWRGS